MSWAGSSKKGPGGPKTTGWDACYKDGPDLPPKDQLLNGGQTMFQQFLQTLSAQGLVPADAVTTFSFGVRGDESGYQGQVDGQVHATGKCEVVQVKVVNPENKLAQLAKQAGITVTEFRQPARGAWYGD